MKNRPVGGGEEEEEEESSDEDSVVGPQLGDGREAVPDDV